MKIYKKRLALQTRILRILTLVSFFHFSGLNNGFTQVFVEAGKIEGVNFAPVAISKSIQFANPLRWKNAIVQSEWKSIFTRSGMVIGFASQNAVQRMLVESNLMQIWIGETIKRAVSKENPEALKAQEIILEIGGMASSVAQESHALNPAKEFYEKRFDYLRLGLKFIENCPQDWGNVCDSCVKKIFRLGAEVKGLWEYFADFSAAKFKGIGYHQTGDKAGDPASQILSWFNGFEEKSLRNFRGDFLFGAKK